jgi:SAM-dependent methyltransferase
MKFDSNPFRIHAFAGVTSSYDNSQELALALAMFQRDLPAGVSLSIIKGTDHAADLGSAIRSALKQEIKAEYFLVAREPALLLGPGALEEMERIICSHLQVDCVLPSDIRGYREGHSANYFTLHGFQKFVAGLQDSEDELIPYDARKAFLFLVRASALLSMELPSDPMEIPRALHDRVVISLNAYVHPFFNYYEEKREDIVEMVPRQTSSILDIGCARGRFGATLKETLPFCRVVGIELNACEAERARRLLDRVVIGDVLTVRLDEQFDCVTCLDMMEHVAQPEALLSKIREEFLREKGFLLLSIPNVGHWAVVEDLLAGRWDYVPAGLFCITHLRFYTLSTVQFMLRDNGFEVNSINPVSSPMPESFHAGIQALIHTGLEIDWSSLTTINYYILARRN